LKITKPERGGMYPPETKVNLNHDHVNPDNHWKVMMDDYRTTADFKANAQVAFKKAAVLFNSGTKFNTGGDAWDSNIVILRR